MILQLMQSGVTLKGDTYSLFWVDKPKEKNGYYLLEIWRRCKSGKNKLLTVKTWISASYMHQHMTKLEKGGTINATRPQDQMAVRENA